ncbi:hypothetical protein [Grimontia sp. NTOU-MAR1]|uniref:hypothetical protein n=1 Tax=Grimontia sp. NTOU-MAR1 TaxID=3111011 RepID=UPI002DBEC8CA|nr:hypothetical protein [Grimontia sp. NTOU-MAR1]WRV99620.1 hypothetical protein VP504_21755 [Grimontia sp. NTOU-MAR1]
MLLPFRKLLPLLLAVFLGWQGFAVAHHKGEHHHQHKVDHECMLCVLGMPAIEVDVVDSPFNNILTFAEPTLWLLSLPTAHIAQNARSPPEFTFSIIYI